MEKWKASDIKEILFKANLSVLSLSQGPTGIFIGNRLFSLRVKGSKLVVKEVRRLFGKKYSFDLSEFT